MSLPSRLRPLTRAARLLPGRLSSSARPFPDFVILGAQKAGTTSLYSYLAEHPEVVAPRWKEIHYFDLNFRRGPDWYRAHFPTTSARNGAVSGEATPFYLVHPLAPARMAATLPDAKLLVLLRDPVERAYSHYQHEVEFGREGLPFADAIAAESVRLAGERERQVADPAYHSEAFRRQTYLTRGRYAEQLETWFEHFDRDQFLIRDSATFQNDPQAVYSDVLRFLHLNDHQLRTFPRHFARSHPEMSPAIREQLVEYFRPYNEKLYGLLNSRFDWDA